LIFYYDSEKEGNPQKGVGGWAWLLAAGYWLLAKLYKSISFITNPANS